MIIIAVIGLIAFICSRYISNTFNEIDEILDNILSKKQNMNFDALKEKRISKLAHKAIQIVKMTTADISQTKEEKETLQSFISDMSHQMKTPLSSISMYTDLLLDGNLSANEQAEFLQRTKTGTEKLKWMMDNLVDISRLEVGAIELNPVLTSIKQTLQTAIGSIYAVAAKKKITIKTIEFDDICVLHDKKWTTEAIINILENAIKYSPSEGEIQIKVEPLSLYTRICITDNGMGIDTSEWNSIFKRFYRGGNAQSSEGVGIGLYLVRLILEKQDGYIMVNSELGQFTTFSVFLQNCKK